MLLDGVVKPCHVSFSGSLLNHITNQDSADNLAMRAQILRVAEREPYLWVSQSLVSEFNSILA